MSVNEPSASRSGDTSAGIAELAGRFRLGARAASQLAALASLLSEDPRAPTTVRAPGAILRDHLADSLVALELEEVRAARALADVGSGAGLPGLPLATALAHAQVDLVEANGHKCEFLALAIERMGLHNASPVRSRVESLTDRAETFDIVTARAVASPAVLAEYAAPLLRIGGHLVAWRGRRDPEAEAQAERAARQLGLHALAPIQVKPYPQSAHRHLHLMVKVRETPARFPRRPGAAAKRPLGRA